MVCYLCERNPPPSYESAVRRYSASCRPSVPSFAYKPCGKPGCKCAKGRGHGPKYYLSVSFPNVRPQVDYVPQKRLAETKKFLAHYQRTREILEQICEINRELLRRREAL